jgi:hypothetical protein
MKIAQALEKVLYKKVERDALRDRILAFSDNPLRLSGDAQYLLRDMDAFTAEVTAIHQKVKPSHRGNR